MKKTKKVILKGNAEAIKKYNKQKFVDKGLEFSGSIIGIIILVLIINSFKSFKEYWADKEDLKKLLKQENQYLTIKDNVCKDFAEDTISKGNGNKECDAIGILRKRIDDNIFGFMLDDDYKKDSIQIAKKNKAKKNLTSKKDNTKAKVSTVKKETKPSGCLEGDCVNGFSKMQYSNGYYIGEFKEKKKNGQGSYVWSSGDKYIGEWKNGNRTGQGTYIWKDGEKYTGDFLNGDRTGKGTYIWKDGAKYTGDFLNGDRTGKGTMLYSDGGRYNGDFLKGDRHGKGTLVWSNGTKYDGEFKENKRDGEGTQVWKNGDKYFGEFFQNKISGEGTFISGEDNTMMVGKFESSDLYDGFVIFPDGFKLRAFKKDGKLVFNKAQGSNQNIDLLAKQLKRNNDLQTSRMLLDISKSLMGSRKNSTPSNLNNLNIGGGFLSGSSSSGMYKTCRYSSSLGTKTKTVFSSAPCPMAY